MGNARSLTIQNQRGSVFLVSVVLVAVMTLLGVAIFDLASIEANLSTGDTAGNQLLYCANAGLGRVMVDTALTPAPGGRMTQITSALATPGSTITWPAAGTEPLNFGNVGGLPCSITTTFTDDTVNKVRLLR